VSRPDDIDLGDFEAPAVPEARPEGFGRTASSVRGGRPFTAVRRWVPVGVTVLVVVGVALLAASSGQSTDSPQAGAPGSGTPHA
jgi:hypothetical protein